MSLRGIAGYSRSERRVLAFTAVLLTWGLLSAVRNVWLTPPDDAWRIGDWLINYQGGIVRRGLIGECLLRLAQSFDLTPAVLVQGLVSGLAAVMFALLARLVWPLRRRLARQPALAALLLSPAFVMFQPHDAGGAGRKELLLFVLLLAAANRAASTTARLGRPALWCGSGLLTVMVLGHEMLAAWLPAFAALAFALPDAGTTKTERLFATCLLPGAIAAAAMLLFRGDAETAAAICASLAAGAPSDCRALHEPFGAISFLAADLADGWANVRYFNGPVTLVSYALALPLVALPIVGCWRWLGDPGRVTRVALIACGLLSLPLLAVVADYGRWLHLHASVASILVLHALRQRAAADTLPVPEKAGIGRWLGVAALALLWRLPHAGAWPAQVFPLLAPVLPAMPADAPMASAAAPTVRLTPQGSVDRP